MQRNLKLIAVALKQLVGTAVNQSIHHQTIARLQQLQHTGNGRHPGRTANRVLTLLQDPHHLLQLHHVWIVFSRIKVWRMGLERAVLKDGRHHRKRVGDIDPLMQQSGVVMHSYSLLSFHPKLGNAPYPTRVNSGFWCLNSLKFRWFALRRDFSTK